MTDKQRFLKYVRRGDPETCWLWLGGKSAQGYGMFQLGSAVNGTAKITSAHRAAYILFVGPVGAKEHVHHRCENPACVNWLRHLEKATKSIHLNELSPRSLGYLNSRKTHCPHGHPFDSVNTIIRISPNGNKWRRCRTCRDAQNEARRF